MKIFSKILQVEDAHGELVDVRLPSIMVTEEFRARYSDLLKMCEEPGIANLPFDKSYATVKKFRRSINNLLGLVGIEGSELSADMVIQLLFPHNAPDEEGVDCFYTQGALIEFIFGPVDGDAENKKVPLEEIDHMAKLMGEMWAVTENFQETLDLLNSVSYDDLNNILEARNDLQMSPEDRAKKQQQEASKKLMKRMKSGELKVTKSDGDGKGTELSADEIAKFI